jgi:DNA-binding transcriptional regulator YhcF (GntR family)
MSRQAREKLVERIYKQRLKSDGRLPSVKERRAIEQKVAKVVERAERRKK